MADDSQQLVYKINVITEGVQGKIAEVSNSLSSVKQTMDKLGASRLEVNTTKSVENFERLSASLREVQKGIELLTRDSNAQVIDLNGIPQTMTSLRLLEMQIQDLQKSIKAASLNEIFKSNQKQQINEVTSALQSQRKAIDDITKSMEQQKAMSQSTYYRRRNDFDSANATLGNYNVAPKDNPYGGSWSDYVKQVQAAGTQRERIEKNIAESQSARQSKANAEANNALKIEQQRQAIAKARADQELATQKQIQAESKKAYVDEQKAMSERSKMLQRDIEERRAAEQKIVAERVKANIAESQSARQARSTAELNNSKQLIQLRNQLQNAENAQNAAIARGNQLEVQRYETLRQQYATAKQALEARGERVSGSEPMSAAQYANPSAFNQQAAISNAMSWDTRGITSYTNEIGKLQRAQESLYAIYKQDPSQQNLANFSATTARLKEVSEQYRVYQRSIQNTGSTMDAFMLKARSHLAWIASGFTIGALFAIPTETVDTMQRIESEMVSIKQVMPEIEGDQEKSNAEMQKFIGIASQYGEAVDKVMDAARSIGRMYGQGDSGIANTNLMTQQAAKMATADAFDMTTATKALESAMAQWGLQTQDTNQLMVNSNRILDTWTVTAHRGAASAHDIGQAIEAAGTAAAQAGVSFEFFNALVETGVRATGRSGNEIGQAIKSMMVSMQTDKS